MMDHLSSSTETVAETAAETAAAWRARYGTDLGPAEGLAALDAPLRQMLAHRSVRAYRDQAVDDRLLEGAVAAAQSASTSSNLQLWSVIAVRDAGTRARLAELAGGQAHVAQAPLFLAWVLDLSRLRRLGQAQGVPTGGLDYLEGFVLGAVDVSLAAQNAAVSFERNGLGLVYIGGMRNHPEAVAELLRLPPAAMVLFGMCVGYPEPAELPPVKPRLPQAAVLHRERYDSGAEADIIAAYDAIFTGSDSARARGARPWSHGAVHRMRGPEALSGRDRLRQALHALGFPLA